MPDQIIGGFHGCGPFLKLIQNLILGMLTRRRRRNSKLGTDTCTGHTRGHQSGMAQGTRSTRVRGARQPDANVKSA